MDNVVWSKYAPLPEYGWDPVNVIPFFPWPEDSITDPADRYSLLVSVRFPATRVIAPLHIAVLQEDDTGWSRADTLTVKLLAPENTPMGRGAYGVFEAVDTVSHGITLRPGYSVELQSLSDPERTKGVLDIGLILSLETNNESFINRLQNLKL